MAYQHKPNKGSIWPNDDKQEDTHPDFKGDALIGDVPMWVSAWLNTKDDGTQWLGLAFKPKDAPQQPGPTKRVQGRRLIQAPAKQAPPPPPQQQPYQPPAAPPPADPPNPHYPPQSDDPDEPPF